MDSFLLKAFKISVFLICIQMLFLPVWVIADSSGVYIDTAEVTETEEIASGVHTVKTDADGEFVCIAVYEGDILKAVSLSKELTYSFPEEGVQIKIFSWDGNMRPARDTVRITQIKPEPIPQTLTYEGEAYCTPDEWGDFMEYIVRLTVVTVDGKITEIKDIAGFSKTGKSTSSTNIIFLNRAAAITSQIIKKQSANVDAVSGATCASYAIMDAVDAALKSEPVKEATPEPTETAKLPVADGTYSGSAQCSSKNMNYMVDVAVIVKDGEIETITDRTLKTPLSSKDKELYKKAWDGISAKKLKIDSLGEIDAVSGATISSNGIILAIGDALENQTAAKAVSGKVYAPAGISLYTRVYPMVTVENGRISDIRIVPVEDTDTVALGAFAEEIIKTQSVRIEYPDSIKDDAYNIANLIDQILYGKGVLKDE